MLVFKMSPEEAYAPLNNISPPLLMYRDAGYGPATYHISVLDCLRGLHRGLSIGLLHLDTFDSEEYEFYERVENGDMNWLSGKFLALASPKDVNPYAQYMQQGRNPIEQQQAFGLTTSSLMPRRGSRNAKHYSVANIPDLIRYFKEKGVTTIVRLNNQLYDRQPFVDAGIEHIEMYFPDGTTPPENILVQFLNLCENTPGIFIKRD
jgi:cell division cycle 14